MPQRAEQPQIITVTPDDISVSSTRSRLWDPPHQWPDRLGRNFEYDLGALRTVAAKNSGSLAFELVDLDQAK